MVPFPDPVTPKGPFLNQSHPKDSLTQSFPRVHSLPYTITARVFLPDPITSKAPSSTISWFTHGDVDEWLLSTQWTGMWGRHGPKSTKLAAGYEV